MKRRLLITLWTVAFTFIGGPCIAGILWGLYGGLLFAVKAGGLIDSVPEVNSAVASVLNISTMLACGATGLVKAAGGQLPGTQSR